MVKKGDTLIEVTIAVGIFSMIAIAMVAVMSNGVANAQTALESTLAREEIDSQAEALRFIQASYINNINEANKKYTKLWKKITENAIILKEVGDNSDVVKYAPKTCEDLYNPASSNNIFSQHAFVINPRKLGEFTEDTLDQALVMANEDSNLFTVAAIYPRLVYGVDGNAPGDTVLTNQYDSLYRAEGIFVVPVRDSNTTTIIGEEGGQQSTSAFYDFYIRTCWYGNRSSDASIISTVIRLYDPDAVPIVESTDD